MWIWIGSLVYVLVGLVLLFIHTHKARERGEYIDVFGVMMLALILLLSAPIWYIVLLMGCVLALAYGIARGIVWLTSRIDKSE